MSIPNGAARHLGRSLNRKAPPEARKRVEHATSRPIESHCECAQLVICQGLDMVETQKQYVLLYLLTKGAPDGRLIE